MAKTILGKVGMTPKGAYNNTTEYVRLDVVTKDGQSYVCLKDCSGKDVTNTTYWQLIASKGEMPVNGVDYNTEEDKQAFKEAVVEDSKTEMDNYTVDKKEELDTYTIDKKTELNNYKKDLEEEMSTTKDNLVKDINNTTTENIEEFNSNTETKTNSFNDNATEKTTNYNTNAETKLKEYNDNSASKLNEYNNNTITKLEEYNTNATNKVEEFNDNVDSLENELTELASQMPWNTTEIQDSIHVEDSAKYSRNKLSIFGNLEQEVSETGNNIFDGIMEIGNISTTTGEDIDSTTIIRSKNFIDISNVTYVKAVRSDGYSGSDYFFGLRLYDENKNFLMYTATQLGNGVDLSKIEEIRGYKYLKFVITNTTDLTLKYGIVKNSSGTYEEFIPSKPSIEYPSTPVVATGVQRISKLGKNYLNIPNTEITTEIGVNIKVEDNKITLNGTATKNLSVTIASDLDIALNGEYTFSQKVLSGSFSEGAYRIYLRNNSITDMFDSPLTFTSTTQKMTNTCNVLLTHLAMFINKGNVFNNYVIALQVENGNEETPYEQPKEKETFELDLGTTELCKMMDSKGNIVAQDRAVYKDGKWQWEKNIVVHIVDKTILQQTATNIAGKYRYQYYPIKNNVVTAKDRNPGICNIFSLARDGQTFNCEKGFALITGTWNFYNEGETLKKFLEKIEGIDIVVAYITLTPIYEDCTTAQSEILDKLYKLQLEKGTNNIYVESENGVTTELQLTYMQDNNMRINNMQEQINALSEAILNLGGN